MDKPAYSVFVQAFALTVIVSLSVLSMHPVYAGEVNGPIASRFLNEYPSASLMLERCFRRIHGSGTLITKQGTVSLAQSVRFWIDNESERCDMSWISDGIKHKKGYECVHSASPHLVFSLDRSVSAQPYQVKHVSGLNSSGVIERRDVDYVIFSYATRFTSAGYGVEAELRKLVSDKNFSITRAERQRQGQVRIEFDYQPEGRRSPFFKNTESVNRIFGSIVVDPTAAWCLNESRIVTDYESGRYTRTQSVEYSGKLDGLPLPKTVRLTLQFADQSPKVCSFQFDEVTAGTVPPETFSLAPFGLENLEVPVEAPTNRRAYTLFACALITLAVGLTLKRYRY